MRLHGCRSSEDAPRRARTRATGPWHRPRRVPGGSRPIVPRPSFDAAGERGTTSALRLARLPTSASPRRRPALFPVLTIAWTMTRNALEAFRVDQFLTDVLLLLALAPDCAASRRGGSSHDAKPSPPAAQGDQPRARTEFSTPQAAIDKPTVSLIFRQALDRASAGLAEKKKLATASVGPRLRSAMTSNQPIGPRTCRSITWSVHVLHLAAKRAQQGLSSESGTRRFVALTFPNAP